MIKIELSTKMRKEIENIFLNDLFRTGKNGQKKGKFIKILEMDSNRNLLQQSYSNFYQYFYDGNGAVKTDAVKELLLADMEKMEALINKFGGYDCNIKFEEACSDELLSNIFRYKNFSKRKVVREMLRKMGITVCPYCNRSYITTLEDSKVRPQLDHYYPKSRYPYLALSLYNLIPSCSICNMAKSDMDTKDKAILYPYEEEFGEKIAFKTDIEKEDEFVKCMTGKSDKWKVGIEIPECDIKEKVINQDSTLHITELYNEHKDYIVDIFKSFHVNTEKRVEELLAQFPKLFSTKEEVRSLMFMNDIRKESWGRRPLAKLTHDIYMQIRQWENAKIQ